MSNKDKFGAIANILPLINRHLQYNQDLTLDDINNAYGKAQQEQIALIRTKASRTTTVKELAMLFRDSCLSFAALGKRADLLMDKVKGSIVDPKVTLDLAIRKDIKVDNPDKSIGNTHIFGELPEGCGYDSVFSDDTERIVSIAYDNVNGLAIPDIVDSKILYLPILLQYLESIGSTLEIQLDDTMLLDYISLVTQDSSWRTRPLLGYYDTDNNCNYIKTTNIEFINLFANKAKSMLESVTAGDFEYYEILLLKTELHNQLASVYFTTAANAICVYNDISKILNAIGQDGTITNKTFYELNCYNSLDCSILRTKHTMSERVYEVNKAGLLSYVEALESLGVNGLTGVAEIITLIKKHCM